MSETTVTMGGAGEQVAPDAPMSIDEVGSRAADIVQNVETVIAGKREAVTAALTVLLADDPGLRRHRALAAEVRRRLDAEASGFLSKG